MHRATPLTSSFRAFSGGGTRSAIDMVDDTKLMQEHSGNFMNGESRKGIEAPQNYGFTSVNMPAIKDALGKIIDSAESVISFMGGNRSFPVAGVANDRRYRLNTLKPGDVAVFDHLQHQLHFNNDGVFITGRTDKKMKFQLAPPPQQQQGSSSSQRDASSSSGSSSNSSSSNKGQKQRYDQQSQKYLEVNNDTTNLVHDRTINYKTGTHNFQQASGSTTRAAGGPLVQIFGDKFTAGLGHFMKQVTAAPPTSPMHLATKGYIDSIFQALNITIPALPPLPMPPLPPGFTLPPGLTLPPGITLPPQGQASVVETPMPSLEARLLALERRVAELERRAV